MMGPQLWPYGRDDALTRQFKRAVRRASLQDDVYFHTLRHTFASYLVESGQPIRQVQQLVGHSIVTVTETYAHPERESLRRAVSVLQLPSG